MSCPRPDTPRSNPVDLGELANPLRDRLYTMFIDAPDRGLTGVSMYRDPGRQWDLRHDRVPGHECDSAYKGHPTTAVPAQLVNGVWVGGSHHQHRTAADIGGRAMRWARENCHRYGLGQTVRNEDWHYEAEGIDVRTGRRIPAPTVRILRYPGPTYEGSAPAPTPTPGGWLMALTDKEQDDLLKMTTENWVRLQALSEEVIGTVKDGETRADREARIINELRALAQAEAARAKASNPR